MSRGNATTVRCLTVWVAVTTAAAATCWLAGGAAAALARPETWQRSFEDLLVAVCAAALLVCAARLWWVTTATTVALVRGRVPRGGHGLTRRLVLAACGAAGSPGSRPRRWPGRAPTSGGSPVSPSPTGPPQVWSARGRARTDNPPVSGPSRVTGEEVVVRAGDSLWSLAAARLPATSGPDEIEKAWRAVYAANRAEIGADPSLIRPGQRLHLPGTTGAGGRGRAACANLPTSTTRRGNDMTTTRQAQPHAQVIAIRRPCRSPASRARSPST